MAGKNGGARPGAGRKKGGKNASTLAAAEQKALARETLRELLRPHLAPIALAQVENAKGVSYMVLRAPDGTFARATDEKQIDAACAVGSSAFQIFTQQPNTQSASMLLAYLADKPVEPVEHSGPDGEAIEIAIPDILKQRHERHRTQRER
jgi:hypothetical protein